MLLILILYNWKKKKKTPCNHPSNTGYNSCLVEKKNGRMILVYYPKAMKHMPWYGGCPSVPP